MNISLCSAAAAASCTVCFSSVVRDQFNSETEKKDADEELMLSSSEDASWTWLADVSALRCSRKCPEETEDAKEQFKKV